MRQWIMAVAALVVMAALTGCADDGEDLSSSCNGVHILFPPSGVGDNGYNDIILYGVQQACTKHNLQLSLHIPTSQADGWKIFENWLATDPSCLFIFVGDDLSDKLREKRLSPSNRRSVVMLETDADIPGVATYNLRMGGGAYIIGEMASQISRKAAILAANPHDKKLAECAAGFRAGYIFGSHDNSDLEIHYISNKAGEGFDKKMTAYRLAFDLFQEYDFVWPLAGGSNDGIYQYTREFPNGIYTAGIDADVSSRSECMIASLVKRLDLLTADCLKAWLSGTLETGPHTFGLTSEYLYVAVDNDYLEFFKPMLQEMTERAIIMENEYEKMY